MFGFGTYFKIMKLNTIVNIGVVKANIVKSLSGNKSMAMYVRITVAATKMLQKVIVIQNFTSKVGRSICCDSRSSYIAVEETL